MNYRHAYHAGSFADCFKHALLIRLVSSFERKPAAYFVLDTHAGAGRYDLEGSLSRRTTEADLGIRLLLRSRAPALKEYFILVEQLGLYPGSPALVRAKLRDPDRLTCCELHPTDAMRLRGLFRGDPRVEVHRRSGWEALRALLPPKESRGLVFIDPPFEAPGEFFALADGLRSGYSRFGHGMFAAWYPIKRLASVRSFFASMKASGIRDIVAVELYLREPTSADRLNGCGLLVINPPFQFEHEAHVIATAVLDGLGAADPGAGIAVIRLAYE